MQGWTNGHDGDGIAILGRDEFDALDVGIGRDVDKIRHLSIGVERDEGGVLVGHTGELRTVPLAAAGESDYQECGKRDVSKEG